MSTEGRRRTNEADLRRYAHKIVDGVHELKGDRAAAAVQALAAAPNDAARQIILELAGLAPDEVTIVFIKAAVRSGNSRVARAAADLLLDVRDSASALPVIAECLRSEDSPVRLRAVEALDVVADPGALDLLADAVSSDDDSVRRAAINSLGFITGSKYHPLKDYLLGSLSDPNSQMARAILESEDVQLRRESAQAMGFATSDQVLPILERFGDDSDTQVRREAVVALAAIGTEAAQQLLERQLDDSDYVVVAFVLDALAPQYGRESAKMLQALQKALKHPSREVRRHAVLMLDHFGLAQVEQTLIQAMHDGDFEVERSAHELLRRLGSPSTARWFAKDAAAHGESDETLMVWEAGTIGIELEGTAGGRNVLPLLERAATTGNLSTRVHAVSELAELCDIADSPVLQQALRDRDEPVRSRAAAGLVHTRDAGLLADVLEHHPDPLVRRSAIQALVENPGGPPGAARRAIQFTSTRTVGMELFGRFLASLEDPDEGVKRLACAALQRYVEFKCPLPVRPAIAALQGLADSDSVSSLVRDDAQQAIDLIADARLAEPIAGLVNGVLEWRGQLARQAHALKCDAQSGNFVLDPRSGLDPDEVAQRWPATLRVEPHVAGAASQALRTGTPLPRDIAQALMLGLFQGLIGCLNGVYRAARAVRLIGETQWAGPVRQWADALQGGPRLDWGTDKKVEAWSRLLPRLRRRAAIEAAAAAESLKDNPEPAALDEACADEDDWVRLAALVTRSELAGAPKGVLEHLAGLCRSRAEEAEFADVVGPAAIVLAAAGRDEFIPVVASVIARTHTDHRFELISALAAAVREEGAAALRRHLSARPVRHTGEIGLALALRCGGHDLDGLDLPDSVPEGAEAELRCAICALRATRGDQKAVAELESALRGGQGRQRYCSAVYLGLVRARSAVPIFASVSDQSAPFPLRSVCASMLVRHGHPGGRGWFTKNAPHAVGIDRAGMAADLSRAVADVIPLMLQCKDVNLGRFV